MPNEFTKNNISVKNLSLWDENPRFPNHYFNKTETELIKYFGSEKFKLIGLAEEMVKDFDLPQLEKIVVYKMNSKNIVLEGNRRLAVYKLLNNPELIDDTKLKNQFISLKSKIKINDNFQLECLVTEDQEEGFRYLERKHMKGNMKCLGVIMKEHITKFVEEMQSERNY